MLLLLLVDLDRLGLDLAKPGLGLERLGLGLERPGLGLERPGLGLDRLAREVADEVERPLLCAEDAARECAWESFWVLDPCKDRELYDSEPEAFCRGKPCKDRELYDSEPEAFCRGNPGVALMDLRILVDDSDIGGDGGVAVAAINDVFIGVVKIGDDTVDGPGERSNISGVCGVDGVRCKGAGFLRRPPCDSAFRSFSCIISVSTFSSDSSVRRC